MKIKKVIIEGFRAYQTRADGTFDFSTPSGDCARFVSIYAPNGFGKTSFYDAVEWALTNNIERFVRDFARIENDNISKSQNQESRRQHILRNRSISDSAPSRVTVTGSGFKEVIKDVPKARAGSRDYLFKREKSELGMEEVSAIFLSQEAIDGFLREEKPDARYARFMLNFGDSDDIYRANLIALKRELAIMLKDLSDEQRSLEDILSAPVNSDIFQSINATIHDLSSLGERLFPILQDFDSDRERQLRSLITHRAHQLDNSSADLQRFLTELETALSELPAVSVAIGTRTTVNKTLAELDKRRAALNRYVKLKENVKALSDAVERAHSDSTKHQSLFGKVPAFNELLNQIAQSNSRRQESDRIVRVKKAELASFEERIAACKRLLRELDISASALVTLRDRSPEIYRDLAASRAATEEKRVQRADRQQRLDALAAKLVLQRELLTKLDDLAIDEDTINSVDLTMISEEGVSPLSLQQAALEKKLRAEKLMESRKALEAFDAQKDQFATLVSLGCELLAKTPSNRCPLCTREHESHDDLLDKILGNRLLGSLEAAAIQRKNDAQAAYEETSQQLAKLIQEWKERRTNMLLSSRAAVSESERALRTIKLETQILDGDIQKETSRAEILDREVLNLTVEQLGQKMAGDLLQIVERRAKEQSDLTICEAEAELRREAVKASEQAIDEATSQIQQFKGSELYVEISTFCSSSAIEQTEILDQLTQLCERSQSRKAAAVLQLKDAKSELDNVESETPTLHAERLDAIEHEEQLWQRSRLEAEAAVSVFISKLAAHLPGYDSSWPSEKIAEGIETAIVTYAKQQDATTVLTRKYSLLSEQLEQVLPYVKSIEARKKLDQLLVKVSEKEVLNAKIDAEYAQIIKKLDSRISGFFYTELINSIYRKIDPHPDFKEVRFTCEFPEGDKPRLHVLVSDEAGDSIAPNLYFSAAQVNILSLSIFLARALHVKAHGKPVGCIFIDDPIHSMDSINVLSTIDLLRTISRKFDRQIILSTHDRNFFELLKRKVPEHEYASKFLELETFGRVKVSVGRSVGAEESSGGLGSEAMP